LEFISDGDKILEKEAEYYSIDDYMKHAKEYFDQEQIRRNCTTCKMQVFVASDDSKVFSEMRNKYPEYMVIGDEKRATSASLASRYNSNSLSYLISDIHMLSLSDFIVCTLSSNVCKLAYELQQLRFVDGSWRIHSLNNHWLNFGSSSSHHHAEQVIYSHRANTPKELSFDVGDTIIDINYKQNGYSFGRLVRNNRSGFYPSYKTNQVIESYSFPTYSDDTLGKVKHLTPNERTTRKSIQSMENRCQREKERCNSLDRNSNGFIEPVELSKYFQDKNALNELLKHIDENQDGKITTKECLTLIKTIGYRIFM